MTVLGWDIGGVNTKAAAVAGGEVRAVVNRPYELQRAPARLTALLREVADLLGGAAGVPNAVTMTAELSQMFRTKREGVHFVLGAVHAALPHAVVHVYGTDGRFRNIDEARRAPLLAAAANWVATAQVVAGRYPNALLIDVGTTTTDVIPIVNGRVAAAGRTDVDRLATGELVYSGALRTPVEAVAADVHVNGRQLGVSAEGFALMGDVHLCRGDLAEQHYTVPTPDGRPATPEFARERLARVVCGDRDLLDLNAIAQIADAAAAAQVGRIAAAITRVCARHPHIHRAVVTGLGDFIAIAAARAAGLDAVSLSDELGTDAARCAPAAAVALLLERHLAREPDPSTGRSGRSRAQSRDDTARTRSFDAVTVTAVVRTESGPRGTVDAVVKIGGGTLADAAALSGALDAIVELSRRRRLLVVPGGGPFADAVREVDRQVVLPADASHWMAVLAMDQYAEVLTSMLPGAERVERADDIPHVLDAGRIPVLAPSRWLREADPLPHSWDVTSDSIAAWVSGVLDARLLILIKPAGASGQVVDPHFEAALPARVTPIVVPADQAGCMLPAVP